MPRHWNFCFLGVNVRSLCVAGFEGGGTPGHLLMGGGVFSIKKSGKFRNPRKQSENGSFRPSECQEAVIFKMSAEILYIYTPNMNVSNIFQVFEKK